MMCWHRFGKWEDVALNDSPAKGTLGLPLIVIKQVIRQQRRCSKCNLVKTRTS